MKIFLSESLVDYRSYTFNYALYCIQDGTNEIPEIYQRGFLPYSNKFDFQEEVYYMARSLRVDLRLFSETSENKRVLKKIAELNPEFRIIPINDFNTEDINFQEFCLHFAKERFSEPLSEERLQYILQWKSLSHIFEFTLEGNVVGYVLTVMEGDTLHYWFAFFDLNYPAYSLGKYMMFSVIDWAKKNGIGFVYLGTVYGEKALYKARDFKGLEFFDGNRWQNDLPQLKSKCKSDEHFETDSFKKDTAGFLSGLS